MLNTFMVMDSDMFVEQLLQQADDTVMPLPTVESNPHILISKVRKDYFEYIVKLLCMNYESTHNFNRKNTHLPSAIWRCARSIEMKAARSCMLVELYRKNILVMIKELKSETKQSKLHKKLMKLLQSRPETDKTTQTTFSNVDTCNCASKEQNYKQTTPKCDSHFKSTNKLDKQVTLVQGEILSLSHIPVLINQTPTFSNVISSSEQQNSKAAVETDKSESVKLHLIDSSKASDNDNFSDKNNMILQTKNEICPPNDECQQANKTVSKPSVDIQQEEDEVMLQLEELFRCDSNDPEDDLFGVTLSDSDLNNSKIDKNNETLKQNNVIVDEQAAIIKSLDERLALLEKTESFTLKNDANNTKEASPKRPKLIQSKWLCEVYYKRLRLNGKLDEIRDRNRKKHARIKWKFLDLFGADTDDEEVMSPLDETPEFVLSCKERIAPWIVKILTPYYTKRRIKGKVLFKNVARHLLKLIFQCSKYPTQYEVYSFVGDFLKCHPVIRCDADYKEFRIDNV